MISSPTGRVIVIHAGDHSTGQVPAVLTAHDFDVVEAPCPLSAIELALDAAPVIFFCAEQMRGLEARDFLEIVRECDQLAAIPIVILGASEDQKALLFRAGCDEFFTLPFEDEEFVARVRLVLKRAQTAGLSGDFSEITLIDLIQMFVAARSTGRLNVLKNGSEGALYIKEGQVFHASYKKSLGEQALLGLMRESGTKEGRFFFSKEQGAAPKTSITKRTEHVLLGLASAIDESPDDASES